MKNLTVHLCRAGLIAGVVVCVALIGAPAAAQETEADLEAALLAIQSTPPMPASQLPEGGTFYSAQHPFDWPPLPGNVHELSAWSLGGGFYLLDDVDLDYEALAELMAAAGFSIGGPLMSFQSHTTNDLWLEIHGVTNDCTGWTADLTIHTPEGDTNASYDVLYTPTLEPPTPWEFLMRVPTNIISQTNVYARYLCEARGFFLLSQTNGSLTVDTNVTPQDMAKMLVPDWVTLENVTYTGAVVARGVFSNGYACGLPIDSGVILSSGYITNALGTNNDTGAIEAGPTFTGPSNLGNLGDNDLDELIQDEPTSDAAVLEFDLVSTNDALLQFWYIYATEEYPEWIGNYNDPMAIFLTTNRIGGQWVIDPTNNLALVPCAVDTVVSVNTINGGCVSNIFGTNIVATRAQYYVDNHDPVYLAVPPYSVGRSVFDMEYDGMTILLTARTTLSADVTNHVKIAIADYAGDEEDRVYDSAVFLKAWLPYECP